MPIYTKESLELLRQRIDLIDALTPFIHFQKSGASFKALCPFHEEKTPSFIIQRSDTHYHCFGCGAHGDAIHFLMNVQKMNFVEAVEYLAEKFSVPLERVEKEEKENYQDKRRLKLVMEKTMRFFHFLLLHSEEAKEALEYLFQRGINLDFIKIFNLGFSPKHPHLFQKALYEEKISKKELEEVGLIRTDAFGKPRDFFSDRIMIPVQDGQGSVIGFSGRKYREETFGGKYVNTPETILFKKKKILFGLHFSKKEIAKKREAIIVEGQLDGLRLVYEGFPYTVAAQGTAFGIEHVKELISLGVHKVFLALDSDSAGESAAEKIGDLFQKEAIQVSVVTLPQGKDPDLFLRERGPKEWQKMLDTSSDYLTFLVQKLSKVLDVTNPSGKNELVSQLIKRVKQWEHPLLVHESLCTIAKLTKTPESMILANVPQKVFETKKEEFLVVDKDRILEMDCLRILLLFGESEKKLLEIVNQNLSSEDFKVEPCRALFSSYIEKSSKDLLSLAIDLQEDNQLFLSELFQKKIQKEKFLENFSEAVQKILDRNWMEKREKIREKIQSGQCSEEEVYLLAKEFDEIKRQRPKVKIL